MFYLIKKNDELLLRIVKSVESNGPQYGESLGWEYTASVIDLVNRYESGENYSPQRNGMSENSMKLIVQYVPRFASEAGKIYYQAGYKYEKNHSWGQKLDQAWMQARYDEFMQGAEKAIAPYKR